MKSMNIYKRKVVSNKKIKKMNKIKDKRNIKKFQMIRRSNQVLCIYMPTNPHTAFHFGC